MDCDDVMLLLAATEQRTLTAVEESQLHGHLETCAVCQSVEGQRTEQNWRWLVRMPATEADAALFPLALVDPIVFGVKNEIAAGGMGRITRAMDRRLGREVAVKEVLEHGLRDRFEREIRVTARLQHPAIVSVYEAGAFPDGTAFYTMPLVEGRTLSDAIAAAGTLAQRLRLLVHVRALTDALAYAHAKGVIHRDLKPGNVLVGSFGETVVIDWGLAKEGNAAELAGERASRNSSLTGFGAVMGTPCFMSPAQAGGLPSDASDDVYALGAILYTVLAGNPPYWDTIEHDPSKLVAATLAGPPTPIVRLAEEAPEDLRAIAERAMSRDKSARFPTAKELAEELARFEAGQLLESRRYTTRELVLRWLRRHWRAVALSATALVGVVLFAVLWTRYQRAAELIAAQQRGARLTDLYSDVSRQAFHIDRDLLRMEIGLEGLASAASAALEGPEPTEAPVFTNDDFSDPATQPPDFTEKTHEATTYRWPVSVDHPVVEVAPGTDRNAVMPQIHRLTPLRRHIRDMVLEAALGDTTTIAPDEGRKRLLSRAGPIDYAYVDLPTGVHVVWPGMANLRSDYDVREASFYQNSKDKRGTRWGAPYIDSTTDRNGDDLVLPCTKGVWSPTGVFLGVAGVEMTVTKMVTTTMAMKTRTTRRASLVDKKGRKVIDSSDANKTFMASGHDEAIAFTEFDLPAITAAIRDGREGILETRRNGEKIIVAFVRLDVLDWYYIVEVDAASLGET